MGLERAKGIEPSYAAWEAAVLPLNYARIGPDHSQSRPRAASAGDAIRLALELNRTYILGKTTEANISAAVGRGFFFSSKRCLNSLYLSVRS